MIRLAKLEEMEQILAVYAAARAFMRAAGNPTQWGNSHPEKSTLLDDIEKGQLYVVERADASDSCACFALIGGVDPTYIQIDGTWRSDLPYGTLHRVASDGSRKGVFTLCADFAKEKYDHLRIDTHEDNIPMQTVVKRNGFRYAGVIICANGTPRLAYDWLKSDFE